MNIVVVETGQQRYGLVVDELHNSEEIVVKPLGRHLKDCPCLSGATILGDGRVALILDVAGIAAHTGMRNVSQKQVEEQQNTVHDAVESLALLLFTNHPGEQFAIPTGLISRIDRVRSDQIDSISGLQLLQFRGQTLRLLSLEDFTSARPRNEVTRLHVIVFSVAGQEVGLIAPHLQDIHEVPAQVDSSALREPGFSGSMIINEKPTRLVDIFELTHLAHPEWFSDQPVQSDDAEPNSSNAILFAEDSDFFRNQVKRFMQEAGFRVVEAVDGLAAWKMLQAGEQVDAVVTDVQMPNMTGFELCSKIKNDSSYSHLPVIALTSLASEEDMRKGQEAGVDDYLVKLDREKLMNALSQFFGQSISAEPKPGNELVENAV